VFIVIIKSTIYFISFILTARSNNPISTRSRSKESIRRQCLDSALIASILCMYGNIVKHR
jgi:hypothetical protein